MNREHQLPIKVLTHLFQYLPVSDLKNVRRVCRRWFEASNDKRLQRKEILVWKGRHLDFDDFVRIIGKSSREIWNFEFRDTKFDNSERFQIFWKRYGSQIKSLTFKDCFLTQKMLESVIVYCDDLREISFEDTRLTCWRRSLFCGLGPNTRLDHLIRSGIRRESLSAFKIRVYENDRQYYWTSALDTGVLYPRTVLTDEFFRGIRVIYPKIEEFIFDSANEIKITDARGDFLESHEYLLQRRIKSTNHVSEEYIPAEKAKFYYPQLVLDFYESGMRRANE